MGKARSGHDVVVPLNRQGVTTAMRATEYVSVTVAHQGFEHKRERPVTLCIDPAAGSTRSSNVRPSLLWHCPVSCPERRGRCERARAPSLHRDGPLIAKALSGVGIAFVLPGTVIASWTRLIRSR